MAWRRRRDEESVAGRALVVPYTARNALENTSNLSADSRARTELGLVISDPSDQQRVTASIPNWLRIVLYHAGTNEGPSGQLPAEIDVPVEIDPTSGRIVEVDVEQAATELAAYRDVAVRWWREEEAPLSDARSAARMPGEAARAAKGLLGTWRGALSGLREDRADGPAPDAGTAAEAEQSRRTANAVKYKLAREPKHLSKVRASALEAGPMMVANVKSGSMSAADFETWLQFQVTSGAVSAEEADEWRRATSS